MKKKYTTLKELGEACRKPSKRKTFGKWRIKEVKNQNREKHVADDGSVCETKEQMREINKRIARLCLPDEIAKIFGWYLGVERTIWFNRNVAKRGLRLKTFK